MAKHRDAQRADGARRFRGGQAPLGYVRTPAGFLAPRVREASLVRALFGQYPARGSLGALIRWLETQGLSNRGRPWTRQTLFWILTNPVYLGRTRTPPGASVRTHPPIVQAEQFARVQETLEKRCRNPNRPTPKRAKRRGDERPHGASAGAEAPQARVLQAAR